jgi:hypothetical protein
MASQAGKYFDLKPTLSDLHDSVQANVGNATWINEFLPFVKGPENNFAEVL